jgi:hypothetical protein
LAKLATGSAKNITPKRENSRFAHPGEKSCEPALARTNFAALAAPARSRARAIISAETSTPITAPAAPTWAAMASVVAPPPQPTSMTRSPAARRARA